MRVQKLPYQFTNLCIDSEDILYADLDMQCVPASRMELDVCGHYARPDVLRLTVQDA